MMEILRTDKVSLVFIEDGKIIHHTIHKPLTDDELKTMLVRGCEVFEQQGAQKWLSDDRGNGPVSEEIERWGREVWNQRMLDSGWKYWAIVLPHDMLVRSNKIQTIIFNLAKLGVTLKLYSNPETALAWLKEQ